jgi:GT2 family glycosyltransferase
VSATEAAPTVCVSLVSHGQSDLLGDLLTSLSQCPEVARLVLTYNLPEAEAFIPPVLLPRTTVVKNPSPRGFAANHNAAARECTVPFLCVLNPDIRFRDNPFPALLKCLAGPATAVVAPAVVNPRGDVEDNARRFPTPLGLILKALGRSDGRHTYRPGDATTGRPDWVAGMFLLIRAASFSSAGGFDEGFRLYYEDVDLCMRFRKAGLDVVLCPQAIVVHDARRTSHRNVRYFLWHIGSILRFFRKHLGRFPAPRTP